MNSTRSIDRTERKKNVSVTINNENKNEKNIKNNNINSKYSVELNKRNTSIIINKENKKENNLKNDNSNPTYPIKQKNKNSSLLMNNEDKNKNKTRKKDEKYLKQKFEEINEIYSKFDSGKTYEDFKKSSEYIVKGLIDILKDDSPLKVCSFIDRIHKEGKAVIWEYIKDKDNKNILFSFLKELAMKKLVLYIDKIFMSGGGIYPLVNRLSREYKKEFNELFDILPKEYQNILRFRTISYSEGDRDYACLLLGGICLMGF